MFHAFPPETVYSYPAPTIDDQGAALAAFEAHDFHSVGEAPTAVYIHVPFCLFLCQFCGFVKTNDVKPDVLVEYTGSIIREIDLIVDLLHPENRTINAVFFGGGTASVLSAAQIEAILTAIQYRFSITRDAALTFEGECLSLRKKGLLDALAAMGFQRLSYGVQTMDVGARAVLNLRPSLGSLQALCDAARQHFKDVSVDFIYGWPGQSPAHLERDLTSLVEVLEPLSIEVFQFEKLDASPVFLHQLYAAGCTDLSCTQLQELRCIVKTVLTSSGYWPKSYTKFTKSTYDPPVSYDQCYYGWDNGNVLGFGRGAQSFHNGAMWGNALDPISHNLTVTQGRPPVSAFASFGQDEREMVTWPRRGWVSRSFVARCNEVSFERKLHNLVAAGLARCDSDGFHLTGTGDLWVPSILHYFLPDSQRGIFEKISEERLSLRRPPLSQAEAMVP